MASMTVNFNNARSQALNEFERVVKIVNSGITENKEIWLDTDEVERLGKYLDQLRGSLCIIALTYEGGNDDFKCVLEEDRNLPSFAWERIGKD